MTVLERSELEASPLADLHAIADQLGLDGFRRLRKGDLVDAILTHEGEGAGDAGAPRPEGPGGSRGAAGGGRRDGGTSAARRRSARRPRPARPEVETQQQLAR